MKPYACAWSYYKIHPGRGLRYVRVDAKQFAFLSKKSRSAFLRKGNPRKCLWTAVYRRLHHKGQSGKAAVAKKSRKVEKTDRAIVGASLELLKKRREEKPEDRKKNIIKAKQAAKKDDKKDDKKAATDNKKAADNKKVAAGDKKAAGGDKKPAAEKKAKAPAAAAKAAAPAKDAKKK
jgi:large subunit ribosomal protein L24e